MRANIENPRAVRALVGLGIGRCRVQYSLGDDVESISQIARELGDDFCAAMDRGISVGPYNIVHVASLLALFGGAEARATAAQAAPASKHHNMLTKALFTMSPIDRGDLSEVLPFYQPYAEPLMASRGDEQAAAKLLDWIDTSWYQANREQAWFDSHKGDVSIYDGYWCFEGAAVAKIMDFATTNWDVCEYWPSDFPAS